MATRRILDQQTGPETWDPRSLAHGVARLVPAVPVKGRFWVPGTRTLDQMDTGHCGAFGAGNEASASPVRVSGITNSWCHEFYYEIKRRKLDPFGLEDGTTSLAVMKLGVIRGLWGGYSWCLDSQGLDDVKRALEVGPVTIGSSWMTGMFDPDVHGLVHATGYEEGGHFYVITGWTANYLGRLGEAYRITNSWGTWRAYIPAADLYDVLVTRDGEGAVVHSRAYPPSPVAA